MRVLVIEDEKLVADMVRLNLEHAGFDVTCVDRGEDGIARAREAFDVIVLDWMLPGLDGIDVAKQLRREHVATPVLMLTARGDVNSRVTGLDAGADDYLAKPFAMPELVARVRALARRAGAARPLGRDIVVAAWRINPDTREARRADGSGERLNLTETELSLLAFLASHAGEVLSRADILETAWGMDRAPTERTVDNYVMRLRKLFEDDPEHPRHFLTLRGVGYRFEP
ncbi:MAG: response regulator transcription factor [Deltaproteobacteria bacterium]|nr:response regulator transcription factor [Deltaproteobacteria bacterium]